VPKVRLGIHQQIPQGSESRVTEQWYKSWLYTSKKGSSSPKKKYTCILPNQRI
jgi:hypothetical protein